MKKVMLLCGALALSGSAVAAQNVVTAAQLSALNSAENFNTSFTTLAQHIKADQYVALLEQAMFAYPEKKEALLTAIVSVASEEQHIPLVKAAVDSGLADDAALIAAVAGGADPSRVSNPTAFGFNFTFTLPPAFSGFSEIAGELPPPSDVVITIKEVSAH